MIYISYRGKLGNQMFQYALARILSQKFNQKIDTRPPKFFFIEDEKTKDFKIYQKNILVDDANFLEILELENLNSTNIIISGYFQNKLFISKYCKKILELFNINYENKKGIFLHYRLGDFENYKNRVVAHEYYIYCLDELLKKSNEKVFISTDSLNHEKIKNLQKKYDAEIIVDTPENAIIYGLQFENKILSLGTFSWWIGFLGNQNNVYCPNIKEYAYGTDIFPLERWKTINRKKYLLKKK
jgi:hypothetical protein